MNNCDNCLNSTPAVSKYGFHRVCCLNKKRAIECMNSNYKRHYIKRKILLHPTGGGGGEIPIKKEIIMENKI